MSKQDDHNSSKDQDEETHNTYTVLCTTTVKDYRKHVHVLPTIPEDSEWPPINGTLNYDDKAF